MRIFFLICIGLLFFTSCDKSNLYDFDGIDIPPNLSVDINNDGIEDFKIVYGTIATEDMPVTSANVFGSLEPLNDNLLLIHQQKGSLFLLPNDTVTRNVLGDVSWSGYNSTNIIWRPWKDGKWDRRWSVLTELGPDYYLGFQLVHNQNKIGWLSLALDIKTGETTIKDKEITDDDMLVVPSRFGL